MLISPFGAIRLFFDGSEVEYSYDKVTPENPYTDVDGCFLINFDFVCDKKPHTIDCILDNEKYVGDAESGERLECIAFYCDGGKISIGLEATFCIYMDYGYDFDGNYKDNGISVDINENTQSRKFLFGVCWLEKCSAENEVQTWFGADPTITYRPKMS